MKKDDLEKGEREKNSKGMETCKPQQTSITDCTVSRLKTDRVGNEYYSIDNKRVRGKRGTNKKTRK